MSRPFTQPTLHLHIGTEKTGTSTLQALASTNRAMLAEHGLFYPETPGTPSHVGLTIFAQEPTRQSGLGHLVGIHGDAAIAAYRDTIMLKLAQEIAAARCPDVLLSNEHLTSRLRDRHSIARLVEGLREISRDIRVLIYLRPQYELVLSSYSTAVKSGVTRPLNLKIPRGNHFYNFDDMLELWESVVGIENIRVRLFTRNDFVGGALVTDFFAALGVTPPDGLEIPEPRNRSLDANTLEFLRIANETVPRLIDGQINPERADLYAKLLRISSGPKFTVSGEDIARIDATFAESNRRVAERYFPGRDNLFEPFSATETPESPPLSVRQAVEIGLALWARRDGPKRRGAK